MAARIIQHGMVALQVINELCKFAQDQRSGRLMLVCLSPYVRKQGAMTSFAIAEEILQKHVPDAICIVMHGGGVNALYNNIGASSSSAPDYSHGDGEAIYVDKKTHVRALAAAGSSWVSASACATPRKCKQVESAPSYRPVGGYVYRHPSVLTSFIWLIKNWPNDRMAAPKESFCFLGVIYFSERRRCRSQ